MRFRFTSPHPKDFPDELLSVIRSLPNACASLHIPAQSGSTSVLSAMRRGYSRQTYLDLINRVRELLPHVSISSDFISGFCGETEEDHQQTLTLLQEVQFDKAFMFAYSMREKTHAHRRLSAGGTPKCPVRSVSRSWQRPMRCLARTSARTCSTGSASKVGHGNARSDLTTSPRGAACEFRVRTARKASASWQVPSRATTTVLLTAAAATETRAMYRS